MNAQTPINHALAQAFQGRSNADELIALEQQALGRCRAHRETAINAVRQFPGLSQLVVRWAKDDENEHAKGVLHTIADVDGDDAAAAKADRAYGRARDKAEKSAYAILDHKVVNLVEAEAKVRAFVASRQGSDISTIPCEEDVVALAEAMLADLKSLRERAEQEGACDATAAVYVGLKGKLDTLASQDSDDRGEYDATLDAWDETTDKLMAEPAKDLRGVAVRLRAILEHGLCMDLDVSSDEFQALLATPPSAKEMYGPHGQGAENPEVLRRAIARLYWDVEQLAARNERAAPSSDSASAGSAWASAREEFLAAQTASEALADQDTIESRQAFTAMCAAELTYAQTPPPNVEALATMLRDVLNFDALREYGDRADNRESIQKLLDDDEAGINYLAMAYQHATRLAGELSEIHEARRSIPCVRAETDAEPADLDGLRHAAE